MCWEPLGSPGSAGKAWRRAWAASKEGGTGLLGLGKMEKKKLQRRKKMLLRNRAAELKIQPLRMQYPALLDAGRITLKWKVQG